MERASQTTAARPYSHPVRLRELTASSKPVDFALSLDGEALAALAEAVGVLAIRKLGFEGRLSPEGRHDWRLDARLGASVVQPCVVTLAPVTTRIDETVTRRYLAELPEMTDLPAGEVEMPEDETAEPLPAVLDLGAVMEEALALALPPYPRAPDAGLGEAVFTEPGKTPLTDEAVRPFAGLAALKQRLKGDDSET